MSTDAIDRRANELVGELGTVMAAQLPELTVALQRLEADAIEPLRGDPLLLDLLHASIASNLEALVDIMRYDISLDEVSTPAAAEEYARRLAQRGVSSIALLRAYRLGQRYVVNWAFGEFRRREPDPEIAFAAGRRFTDFLFRYIDSISERLVHTYEAEREAWLANRDTVRLAMAQDLINGKQVDTGAAERALGYRLGQHHLGVVLWSAGQQSAAGDTRHIQRHLIALAEAGGAKGRPLFVRRDECTVWGWIPLGDLSQVPNLRDLRPQVTAASPPSVAFGTPGTGAAGFRVTHIEANRARQVALVAGSQAQPLISFSDPEVRTAAMLAADPEGTRRLVAKALGRLAVDTKPAERLRDTLMTFLSENGSYTATAERVHLHKNTVYYRVDKAVEVRGRPLDEERLELELALIACRWLGASVLRPA